MKKVNRYQCPSCGQYIILYGGRTDGTCVICEKCNVWMHIANPHGIPKIINCSEYAEAGQTALEISFVPDSTKTGEKQ